MSTRRDELVNPGKRLPDLSLPLLSGGVCPLRQGRKSPVLLLVHGAGCTPCDEFVREVELRADAMEEWDGRVLVLAPGGDASGVRLSRRFPVLMDPERKLAAKLSVEPPATIIADQWGEIHLQTATGAEHRFPSADEIEEWLRFLAIQCPECEGEAL